MSAISTHVLDTALGRPAAGIAIVLEVHSADGQWKPLGQGVTDSDGRVREFLPAGAHLDNASYRLTFDTAAYLRSHGAEVFYPRVEIVFQARAGERYHVPLLLSPYGYSTYRGS